MDRLKVIAFVLAALVVLSVGYFALASQKNITGYAVALPHEKIRVGYLAITSALPLFVGIQNGYFNEVGIDVEPIKFESSNQILDALAAGSIDASVSTASTTSLVVEEKSPGLYKVFGVNANSVGRNLEVLLVRASSSISKPLDLRGRKIGTFPGTLTVVMLKRYLREEGLSENETTIIELPSNLHLQALESGRVDAVLTYEPTGTIGVSGGVARVLVKAPFARKILNPWPGGFFMVSTAYLKKNGDAGKKLAASFDKSAGFIRNNETEARRLLTKFMPIREEIAMQVPLTTYWKKKEIDVSQLQRFADIFLEEGALTKKIDVRSVILDDGAG